ncbi:MAG: FtsH protease activity modulator HflK [Treponema sp.]|nr:FtsH protease activity modulator HflK [Treponema sp.]
MSNSTKKVMQTALKPSSIIALLIAAIVAGTFFSSMFVVDQAEQAVITRFGRYYKTLGPGLQVKLPFGIDKKYIVPGNKVVQTEQFGFKTTRSDVSSQYQNNITTESTMLTGDLNIVDVEWIIQYRIVDPRQWLFSVQDKERTIRDISRSVINELVGDRAILNIMGSERANIENLAISMMNDQFKKLELGINVSTVKLQNIVPPAGVQDAFEDVNKAIQDMNRFINEGKESYNSEIPKTQGQADQQIQISQGYAAERINKAKGDVARFNSVYSEYKKAPDITKERLYLEAMEEIFQAYETNNRTPALIDGTMKNVLPFKDLNGTSKSN